MLLLYHVSGCSPFGERRAARYIVVNCLFVHVHVTRPPHGVLLSLIILAWCDLVARLWNWAAIIKPSHHSSSYYYYYYYYYFKCYCLFVFICFIFRNVVSNIPLVSGNLCIYTLHFSMHCFPCIAQTFSWIFFPSSCNLYWISLSCDWRSDYK